MWIFPAMMCATIAIDLIVNVINAFLSSKCLTLTNLPIYP